VVIAFSNVLFGKQYVRLNSTASAPDFLEDEEIDVVFDYCKNFSISGSFANCLYFL
jgi:hypothetical protein